MKTYNHNNNNQQWSELCMQVSSPNRRNQFYFSSFSNKKFIFFSAVCFHFHLCRVPFCVPKQIQRKKVKTLHLFLCVMRHSPCINYVRAWRYESQTRRYASMIADTKLCAFFIFCFFCFVYSHLCNAQTHGRKKKKIITENMARECMSSDIIAVSYSLSSREWKTLCLRSYT